MPRIFFVHLALFVVACLYAFNYVIAKFATPQYLMPFGLVVIRSGGATLLFWVLHSLVSREKVKAKTDYWRFMYCGLFGVTANQLLFFKGLSLTSSINASIIITATPIVVLIASVVLLKEKLTWRKLLGVGLGMGGAIGIILQSSTVGVAQSNPWGDLFILLNAMSYGVYLVLVKPLMQSYQPLTVVKWIFLFGFVGIVPFGIQELMAVRWEVIPNYVYWIIAYIILGATFGVYLLNAWALRFVNATLVSIYIYLQPVLTSSIAISMQQDSLNLYKVAFALCIFAGVYLVNQMPRKTKKVGLRIS